MNEEYAIEIHYIDDTLLLKFPYSIHIPLPGIGYFVWVEDVAYEVIEIFISYDHYKKVYIRVKDK
jgi:hypothetical protein